MSSQCESANELSKAVKLRAAELGFELSGITSAARPEGFERLQAWLEQGFAGEMHYLPRREAAYQHPRSILPPVRCVIMLGMNYHSTPIESNTEKPPTTGRIASYACGHRDYHDVLRERLHALADFLHQQRPGCRTRVCVDTAPLLERDFAKLAGLGWFGKNTMLINKRLGSDFFLAALLTDVELRSDEPHHTSHCGTCMRCLEACPTQAFVEPYVLDARRCISYLTIELRDQPIPVELRPLMGNWVFGCDICQDVCPWNRKAPISQEPDFVPREMTQPVDLTWLLELDDSGFCQMFSGTPLERTGRSALRRNAAIAIANNNDSSALPNLERAAKDADPLVRDAAVWGIETLTKHLIG